MVWSFSNALSAFFEERKFQDYLNSMSNRTLAINDDIHHYLLDHSLRESDSLKALREETMSLELSRMQIAPEQGQFMAMLVRMLGAKNIIELGVFTGYSTLCMAQVLPEDGRVLACDLDEVWTTIARKYWQQAGVDDKIELHLAPAKNTLAALIDKGEQSQFDFAFIDADKENYFGYYEQCLELLRPGGVIAVDNVLWDGHVADSSIQDAETRAIRALNKHIHQDQRVDISLVPVGDGLTLARKR